MSFDNRPQKKTETQSKDTVAYRSYSETPKFLNMEKYSKKNDDVVYSVLMDSLQDIASKAFEELPIGFRVKTRVSLESNSYAEIAYRFDFLEFEYAYSHIYVTVDGVRVFSNDNGLHQQLDVYSISQGEYMIIERSIDNARSAFTNSLIDYLEPETEKCRIHHVVHKHI